MEVNVGVETLAPSDLDEDDLLECSSLWSESFPKSDRTKVTMAAERARESAGLQGELWHIVWEAKSEGAAAGEGARRRAVALARTFHRTIECGPPDCRTQRLVRALAHVFAAPDRRGRGLGRMVVQAAFSSGNREDTAVDAPCPLLFQSNESAFYEKMGAAVMPRDRYPVINSMGTGSDAKRRSGFWDDFTMVFPVEAANSWPDGSIDLLGPGY